MAKSNRQEAILVRTLRMFARGFMRNPNINGIAIGNRRKDGEIIDELVIKFFVERKRPMRSLRGEMIPPWLPAVKYDGTSYATKHIFTDVEEAGRFWAASSPRSGDNIDVSGNHGTFCVLLKDGGDGQYYGLTCAHVLDAHLDGLHSAVTVFSNGSTLIGGSEDVLDVALREASSLSIKNIDAGLFGITVDSGTAQTYDGKTIVGCKQSKKNERYGISLEGVTLQTDIWKTLNYNGYHTVHIRGTNIWYDLTNTFTLDVRLNGGDSGSLLYMDYLGKTYAVGMLVGVAESRNISIFHEITAVLDCFSHRKLKLA